MIEQFQTWEELKKEGSKHYKDGDAQMIDVYKGRGIFTNWALPEIAQHAVRNAPVKRDCFIDDMVKVIHYARLLIAEHLEKNNEKT